jgi:cytochrome c551/c552
VTKPEVGALALARDLNAQAAAAQTKGQPLVVLVSRSDCTFCHEVRVQYLAPMQKDGALTAVELVSDAPGVVTIGKEKLTPAQAARGLSARFYPTVLFLDADLKPLAEPLIGAGMAGFYAGFLERALEQSREALKRRL